MKIADAVKEIAEPIIEGLDAGIELIEVEYVKEGSEWYLRLYIDKVGGVSLDDCQLVSESLNDILDEKDPVKGKYIFEVSSPGIDRPLKTDRDFERYKGAEIELHLYAPVENSKLFIGKLIGRENSEIIIEEDTGKGKTKERRFNVKDVSLVKRTIIWN
ncbi:MAG: ribosome maturation factor RimP [Ruminococcaceae bacterium]|nr:ribosome maturation factor RimP [Oscillospiraceae bacterium]